MYLPRLRRCEATEEVNSSPGGMNVCSGCEECDQDESASVVGGLDAYQLRIQREDWSRTYRIERFGSDL